MQKYRQAPDVESVNNYCTGGFHPVHLNDTFKNNRYTVVHKLGYGSYATVWLVRDSLSRRYASLKILTADASGCSFGSEVAVLRHLQARHGEGKDYVLHLLDQFEHEGPNGTHQCIVTEVLGPSLASDIEDLYPTEVLPANIAKRIAAQVSRGITYLHKNGVVHGDLHLANLLLYSPSISSWSSQEEVEKYLGTPLEGPVFLISSDIPAPPNPHIPSYCVSLPDPTALLHLCLDDPSTVHVKICDFSESFLWNPCQKVASIPHCPRVYAAPEIIFDNEASPASDIWALAVLMHVIFTGGLALFPSYRGEETEILREMVLTLGKLPEKWWVRWSERGEYFDEDGHWVGDTSKLLRISGKFLKVSPTAFEGEEREDFERMLRKMVAYDPKKRLQADEVVKMMPDRWIEDSQSTDGML